VSNPQGSQLRLEIAATMKAAIIAALWSALSSVSGLAGTFVYVSNADDGDIGMYALQPDGSLHPRSRFKAESQITLMAVRPDRHFLVAAISSKSNAAYSYGIDPVSGALLLVGTGPLAANMTYITFDRGGRFLLGASYGANLVSVNSVAADGRVGDVLQVIPTARNAHAIRIDNTNRFAFAPHLGTDQIFQFLFDADSGRLMANTPPVVQLKQGTGPRHLVIAPDNRFVFVLNELTATVTTLALDPFAGTLTEHGSVSMLPPDSKLSAGLPRAADGRPAHDPTNDIWAADLHLTPDGRFLYASERTSSTLGAFRVDGANGKLTYLASTPTEKQPRGFNIDPSGRFLVVAGEKSDTLSSYAIDSENGALKLIGRYPAGKAANWVEIVAFD
jgi:6-phosphogluconolactonase